jgi:hypothetical protein
LGNKWKNFEILRNKYLGKGSGGIYPPRKNLHFPLGKVEKFHE